VSHHVNVTPNEFGLTEILVMPLGSAVHGDSPVTFYSSSYSAVPCH